MAFYETEGNRCMGNSNGEPDKDIYSIEATVEAGPEAIRERERNPFKSFRYRDYRFFWSGALVSNVGTWMQTVAVGWVVYDITKTGNPSAALGVINFLNFLPTTLLTLFAGLFADRLNRKQLIIVAQILLMMQALVLARLTQVNDITIVSIGGLVLFGGVITAFVFPAWQAMLPDIVPGKSLLNAVALNAAQFNGARLLGPLLGGLVFARYGAAEVFYVNAISFLFVIGALALIHPQQEKHVRSGGGAISTLTAGLRYSRENRLVAWLLISVLMLSLFGMPYITLMPVIAAQVLGQGAAGYSVLMGASGLGAVVGALSVASLPQHVGRGMLVCIAVLGMGVALLAFSLSRNYYLSVGLVSLVGASFLTGTSAVMTGVQSAAPPRLRGRVMALFVLCFIGIQPFSSLIFGWLGGMIGPESAVLGGAVVLLAYAVFLWLRPGLLVEPEENAGG
ncbi:MAG: MFS transporter [Thermoleophilia bacterium]|nr:MFS transporter [Thermoleophilia bacterium]